MTSRSETEPFPTSRSERSPASAVCRVLDGDEPVLPTQCRPGKPQPASWAGWSPLPGAAGLAPTVPAANMAPHAGNGRPPASLPEALALSGGHSHAAGCGPSGRPRARLTFGHLVENQVDQDVGATPAPAVAADRRTEVRTRRTAPPASSTAPVRGGRARHRARRRGGSRGAQGHGVAGRQREGGRAGGGFAPILAPPPGTKGVVRFVRKKRNPEVTAPESPHLPRALGDASAGRGRGRVPPSAAGVRSLWSVSPPPRATTCATVTRAVTRASALGMARGLK